MKNNAFKLLILSGIALCGLSALALNHTTLVEDIVESTNDTLNNCLVTNVRNCQIGESSEVKVSKTYVQLGQSEDLLVLRFATAISGSIKSAYYTRTCEGLGEKTFEVSNVYQGIKAGEEIFYYDEVEGKPTTNEEVKGQYYWACYVVAFETNAYKASDFNVELTVVTEEDEEVVAESKTQSLHAAICYEDLTNSLANRNDSIVVESDVLPPEGGKAYLLNNSMQETKRYYSSINVSFKERTDIENKKIEMDFKVLGNLYKLLLQHDFYMQCFLQI